MWLSMEGREIGAQKGTFALYYTSVKIVLWNVWVPVLTFYFLMIILKTYGIQN